MLKKTISLPKESIQIQTLQPSSKSQQIIIKTFYVNERARTLISIETEPKAMHKFIRLRIGKFKHGILVDGFIIYKPCVENGFLSVEQGTWYRNGKEKETHKFFTQHILKYKPNTYNKYINYRIGKFKQGVLVDGVIIYKPCAENGFLVIQQGKWTQDGVETFTETAITAPWLPQGVFTQKRSPLSPNKAFKKTCEIL